MPPKRAHGGKNEMVFSQARVDRSNCGKMVDTTIEPCGPSCYHARLAPLGLLDDDLIRMFQRRRQTAKFRVKAINPVEFMRKEGEAHGAS
jgi:hypothetical protein